MKYVVAISAVLIATVSYAVPGLPESQPRPTLSALTPLEAGDWALRGDRRTSGNRNLCIADPTALLQIEHGAAICSRFVIASDARSATVHYTCPGSGHGRTTIRTESPRLVQIETQGILNNQPFAASWEGRRTGQCGPKSIISSH